MTTKLFEEQSVCENITKEGMTVQELCRKADPELAAYAFLTLEPLFGDDVICSPASTIDLMKKIITQARHTVEQLGEIDVKEVSDYRVFIWEKAKLNFNSNPFIYHDAIALSEKDIETFADSDTGLWDNNVIEILENNHIYACSLEELASLRVPKAVINKYGIEACVGMILQYTPCYLSGSDNRRQGYIKKIKGYIKGNHENSQKRDASYVGKLKRDVFLAPRNVDLMEYRLLNIAYDIGVRDIEKRIQKSMIEENFNSLIKQIEASMK